MFGSLQDYRDYHQNYCEGYCQTAIKNCWSKDRYNSFETCDNLKNFCKRLSHLNYANIKGKCKGFQNINSEYTSQD